MERQLCLHQVRIRERLEGESQLGGDLELVGGCSQLSLNEGVASAVISLRPKDMKVVDGSWAYMRTDMDYVAGFLSYREGPAVIKAFDCMKKRPQVLLVPAAGEDHPRGMGMARHLGYLLSTPTVGVTMSPLTGDRDRYEPISPRLHGGVIYVSEGWGLELEEGVKLVKQFTKTHRVPEPIHLAKLLCRAMAERHPGL